MIKEGDRAPDFCLKNQFYEDVCLRDYRGRWLVLFFYRNHFGLLCGRLIKQVNDNYNKFRELGVEVLGIGASELELGKLFAEFLNVKFSLLSDENLDVSEKYGILAEDPEDKIRRCTVIVDPKGVVRKIWIYEDVENHVKDVLKSLEIILSEK